MAVIVLGLAGCTVGKVVTPAPVTTFLAETGADTSAKVERLPFDHTSRSPAIDLGQYKYIVVRPVSINWLRKDEWEESTSAFVPDEKSYLNECGEMAKYYTTELRKAFSSPVCVFYITGTTTRPGTLILEVALTELAFGTPPSGLGSMAFEARVKDASTGKYIATVSDRRATVSKITDFNKDTYTRANEQIIKEWSKQLMEASNKELFPRVRSSIQTPF